VTSYGGSAPVAFAAAFTDASFACNRRLEAKAISARATVYSYEFNDQTAPQALIPIDPRFAYKAYHASEVQYLFTIPASQYLDTSGGLSASQQTLAADMAGYWARFAVSGNPNATGSTTWPTFGASEEVLQLAPSANKVTTSFANDHKCSEWTPGR
jgi:para-nitrobenzyl esterase